MLHKLIVLASMFSTVLGCGMDRDAVLKEQKKKVNDAIKVGDDIYEARDKIISEGFRIQYGPAFPTKTRKYLMMVVDYGIQPTSLETFKYTAGIKNDGLISGVIKADADGTITSIE
jgi:hypothetical protein